MKNNKVLKISVKRIDEDTFNGAWEVDDKLESWRIENIKDWIMKELDRIIEGKKELEALQ